MKKTLIKLIARFVGNRCVSFDGSRVLYWKVPMIVLPMKTLAFLEHTLEKEISPDSRKIIYSLGKIQGKNGSNILIERFNVKPDAKDLSFFIEQTEFVGIGKITLLDFDVNTGHYKIKFQYSSNAEAYLQLFNQRDKPVCDYVRGLIAGALEAISKRIINSDVNVEVVETECQAKGDPACIFEAKKSSEWDSNDENISTEMPIENEALTEAMTKQTLKMLMRSPAKQLKNPDTELYQLVKKRIGPRPFVFGKQGVVSLFDIETLITPVDMSLWLYSVLRKTYGERVDGIFYDAGDMTGQITTENLFNKLNLDKENQQHIKIAFGLIGFFGLGRIEVAKLDTSNKRFIFRLYNGPADNYRGIFGTSKNKIDFFISGIISGICESLFGKKFKTVEEKCAVEGGQFCIFKTELI